MNIIEVCTAIEAARRKHSPKSPIISTMAGMHTFDDLGITDRRLDSVPLMGGASGLGLGISLMRPDLPVIVVDGDAGLLMELGSLVTVANNRPNRFVHIVIHNNTQFSSIMNFPTPATGPDCDLAAMARAAGYQDVREIDDLEEFKRALPELLGQTGASFVDLRVESGAPRVSAETPQPLLPDFQFERMCAEVKALKTALAGDAGAA